jgi:hypothetical protein
MRTIDLRAITPPALVTATNTWENQAKRLRANPTTGVVEWTNKWALGNPNRKHCEYAANTLSADFRSIGFEGTPVITGSTLSTNLGVVGHFIQFNTAAVVGDWAGFRSQNLHQMFKWVWDPTIEFTFRPPISGGRMWVAASKEALDGKANPLGVPLANPSEPSRTAGLRFDGGTAPVLVTNISSEVGSAGEGTFTRTVGSWIDDGYAVGRRFTTSGFAGAGSNGTWTVLSVTALVVTVVDSADAIVTEAAEAGQQAVGVALNTGNFDMVSWGGDGTQLTTVETSIAAATGALLAYKLRLEVESSLNMVRWYLYSRGGGIDHGLLMTQVWDTMPANQLFGIECVVESLDGEEHAMDIARIVVEHD